MLISLPVAAPGVSGLTNIDTCASPSLRTICLILAPVVAYHQIEGQPFGSADPLVGVHQLMGMCRQHACSTQRQTDQDGRSAEAPEQPLGVSDAAPQPDRDQRKRWQQVPDPQLNVAHAQCHEQHSREREQCGVDQQATRRTSGRPGSFR